MEAGEVERRVEKIVKTEVRRVVLNVRVSGMKK